MSINKGIYNKLDMKYTDQKALLKGVNDLETWCNENPEIGELLKKEWVTEKNGDISKYKPGSGKRVVWKCSLCGEEFNQLISLRTGKGCIHGPCGHKKGTEKLRKHFADKLEKEKKLAYAYPELMIEWDYETNNAKGHNPENISAKSCIKANWICSECGKKFETDIRTKIIVGLKCKKCRRKERYLKKMESLRLAREQIEGEDAG